MQISGTVENVRFRNEENGYTVAVVETEIQPYIVVGCFPPVTEGSFVTCTGELVENPKFGLQMKADSVKIDMPNSTYGLVRFLSSGIIKGIGQKRAEAIVFRFGDKTLDVLENWPERLSSIPGISKKMAAAISKDFNEVKISADAVSFLIQGMSSVLAFRVFAFYGADTIAAVSTNPYRMIDDIAGIGFITADKLAKAIGIREDSDARIKAGIQFMMTSFCEHTGNTVCFREDIIVETLKILGLSDDRLISGALDILVLERKIKEVECEGRPALMHYTYFAAENKTASQLCQMLVDSANSAGINADGFISHFEEVNGVKFHDEQKKAILNAVNSGVCVITGGPGTGKTTIIKCILEIFNALKMKVVLLAPTGRAAKRLSESTSFQSSTIHRLLLQEGEKEGGLNADAVIVDEFSMVDVLLMNRLLTVLSPSTKFIMVGDIDQLPSVGPGNVLSDIISSGMVPVAKLSHIYRQSSGSMIVTAAHQINRGECPNLSETKADFFFIPASSAEETADTVVSLVTSRLPKYLSTSPDKIQVLCPMKNGEAGSNALNLRLRRAIIGDPEKQVKSGEFSFAAGDKVIHIINNYDIEWVRDFDIGKGVFNGDIGTVTEVYPFAGDLLIQFEDGRVARYNIEDKKQLMHAYAITVHKSQGSEYDAVVLPVYSGNPMIMTRNLLYTAVTRAKRLVVLVGSEGTVRKMISNNYISKRYSMLRQFLLNTADRYERLYGKGLLSNRGD